MALSAQEKTRTLSHAGRGNGENVFYLSLILFAVIFFWVLPLHSPFWLDETLTYWLVQGSFAETIEKALPWPSDGGFQASLWAWPPQLGYTALAWSLNAAFGSHPEILRLPSLAAMAGALLLLYRTAQRLFHDRELSLISVLLFALLRPVAFAACDFRVYAMSMLAVIGATLLLLRWIDSDRLSAGVVYALAAALILHLQFLHATILIVHALYAIYRWRHGTRPSLSRLAIVAGVFLAGVAPAAMAIRAGMHNPASHSFTPAPWTGSLLQVFAGDPVVLGLVFGIGLAWLLETRLEFKPLYASRAAMSLVILWTAIPVLVNFLLSNTTSARVFVDRYLLPFTPGLALLLALGVRSVPRRQTRWGVLLSIAMSATVFCVITGQTFAHRGSWEAALRTAEKAAAPGRAPVFIRSEYINSAFLDWKRPDPQRRPLYSQLSYTPIDADVLPLPIHLSPEAISYLEEFCSGPLATKGRFLFMASRTPASYEPFLAWFEGRLGREYKMEELEIARRGPLDHVVVFEFSKKGGPSAEPASAR